MELPIREKGKVSLLQMHMCAGTLIPTVTIAILIVTLKKFFGNSI
jgi:hypothetical protein